MVKSSPCFQCCRRSIAVVIFPSRPLEVASLAADQNVGPPVRHNFLTHLVLRDRARAGDENRSVFALFGEIDNGQAGRERRGCHHPYEHSVRHGIELEQNRAVALEGNPKWSSWPSKPGGSLIPILEQFTVMQSKLLQMLQLRTRPPRTQRLTLMSGYLRFFLSVR
jgi:hypothetical protein